MAPPKFDSPLFYLKIGSSNEPIPCITTSEIYKEALSWSGFQRTLIYNHDDSGTDSDASDDADGSAKSLYEEAHGKPPNLKNCTYSSRTYNQDEIVPPPPPGSPYFLNTPNDGVNHGATIPPFDAPANINDNREQAQEQLNRPESGTHQIENVSCPPVDDGNYESLNEYVVPVQTNTNTFIQSNPGANAQLPVVSHLQVEDEMSGKLYNPRLLSIQEERAEEELRNNLFAYGVSAIPDDARSIASSISGESFEGEEEVVPVPAQGNGHLEAVWPPVNNTGAVPKKPAPSKGKRKAAKKPVKEEQIQVRTAYHEKYPQVSSNLRHLFRIRWDQETEMRKVEKQSRLPRIAEELATNPLIDESLPSTSSGVVNQRRDNNQSLPSVSNSNVRSSFNQPAQSYADVTKYVKPPSPLPKVSVATQKPTPTPTQTPTETPTPRPPLQRGNKKNPPKRNKNGNVRRKARRRRK